MLGGGMPLFPGIILVFQLGNKAGSKDNADGQQKNRHGFPGIHPMVFPEPGRPVDLI
jgi:hypothetical protein